MGCLRQAFRSLWKHQSEIQRPFARGCVWNLKLCPHEARNLHDWFSRNSMPYVMATLRMSRRSGQIKLRSCVHLTDGLANFVTWMVAKCCINWHLTVAKCAVPSGISHRLCCNKRASVLLALARGCVWNLKLCPHEARNLHDWFSRNSMPYVMATLRMSRRSGQIKLRSCIHLTDGLAHFVTWMVEKCCINWHLAVAKCALLSGLSNRLVADCATVWVCNWFIWMHSP